MFAWPADKRSRRTLLLGALAGVAFSLALVFYLVLPDGPATPNAALREQEKVGLPVHLKIPKIGVDAPIERAGLTPDGAMDVPKDAANTAWYERGPRPGKPGSAVIDGHFDREGGAPAVFANLNKLEKGDKLTVEDENGTTITFVVRESRKYDPEADATAVFRSSDGRAHLNLITCAGAWDTAQQTYSNRLVVFTDEEMSR